MFRPSNQGRMAFPALFLRLIPLLACGLWHQPAPAEIRYHGGGKELPSEQYIRVVPESESPVEQIYIRSRDGVYVAAALRKPKGPGPFPALIHFHGAPGGRGMEQLVNWARGNTGGPVWERFLQEGFVVVVADYRGGQNFRRLPEAPPPDAVTFADDGVAVVEYVRRLAYVDPARITLYGVSLGGDVTLHTLTRTTVHSAILGAPAPISFLGAKAHAAAPPQERFKDAVFDSERARARIARIQTPVLILCGTPDGLFHLDKILHDLLAEAGKRVRMEVYEDGYHDFCMGPQGHAGRKEPLLESTLDALQRSLDFVRDPAR